jgi:hypothetical protein
MRQLTPLLGLLLAASLLASCGGDKEQEAAAPAPAEATQLTVEVTEAASAPLKMQLRCQGTCDVAKLDKALKGAEDPARACTMVYGGPERAHVTGTVEGRKVDVTLTRNDGCAIADYEALFAAFGREAPIAG